MSEAIDLDSVCKLKYGPRDLGTLPRVLDPGRV